MKRKKPIIVISILIIPLPSFACILAISPGKGQPYTAASQYGTGIKKAGNNTNSPVRVQIILRLLQVIRRYYTE